MRKRMIAILLIAMFLISGFSLNGMETKAAGEEEDMDVSYLLLDGALVGYAELKTRGIWLLDGYSSINDAGTGKVGCGGITNAALRCRVTVNAVVERKDGSDWVRVAQWTQTNENAFTASVSKYLYVTSGYWYRVRSLHYAATDASSSWTNALWM